MTAIHRAIAVTAACASLAVAGCGGGSGEGAGSPAPTASRATLTRVNANCRNFRADIAKLGKGALSGNASIAAVITERLIQPSIPLIEQLALHQQKLAEQSRDPRLILYAKLFEPFIVLAKERLRTGRVSEQPGKAQATIVSRGLENLMTSIAMEQRQIARRAGINACAINFQRVLTSSLSG